MNIQQGSFQKTRTCCIAWCGWLYRGAPETASHVACYSDSRTTLRQRETSRREYGGGARYPAQAVLGFRFCALKDGAARVYREAGDDQ
jgi:hypothetical protein